MKIGILGSGLVGQTLGAERAARGHDVMTDATNPLATSPAGPPTLVLGHTDSGGMQVQRWLGWNHAFKLLKK